MINNKFVIPVNPYCIKVPLCLALYWSFFSSLFISKISYPFSALKEKPTERKFLKITLDTYVMSIFAIQCNFCSLFPFLMYNFYLTSESFHNLMDYGSRCNQLLMLTVKFVFHNNRRFEFRPNFHTSLYLFNQISLLSMQLITYTIF